MLTCRRMQTGLYLFSCIKFKSKWLQDLNIKPTTLNLKEEKVGSTLKCIGTGDHFLTITPVAQTQMIGNNNRQTINKWETEKLL